jgi:hypothetical protein
VIDSVLQSFGHSNGLTPRQNFIAVVRCSPALRSSPESNCPDLGPLPPCSGARSDLRPRANGPPLDVRGVAGLRGATVTRCVRPRRPGHAAAAAAAARSAARACRKMRHLPSMSATMQEDRARETDARISVGCGTECTPTGVNGRAQR